MTRKRYNVRLRLAATVVAAVLSLSGCTFQEMDRMSRKAQASGDIAREHVSEQMRSSQGALVWTDKPWVNLKPVPTVSRDTPLENFPDCQITLARDGLTLPEIGERITALCGVRVIFSPDALAVGQSSGTTRALNGPLPTPDNNGRIPLDQLGGAVDRAGVTATPLVLSGLRWQGKLSGLLDMIAARTGLTPRMDNGAILFSLLETRTFQFTFLNTNITSNASVTSGSTSSMGTSGGTTNSSVSGDSSSSQQTTVDQSRNVYDDMKKTLETMLTPQKGRFWLSASTGTLTVTDSGFITQQDDYKAGAVIAQRVADIITRSGQIHVYQPLVGHRSPGYWPPDPVTENTGTKNHKWQRLSPALSQSCAVFPDTGGHVAENGNYAWALWQPYSCCKRRGQTFLYSTNFS
ncbi:TraU family protein [Salmonella enterica]|nr:TraU family protein [Salmonella enterica]EIL0897903.1 TraU family protein [Salmonella enterica]EIO1478582.1 TraU family protein [Salmonella enterica]EIO4092234.1 TraU family protein [Salmonella enterica]EIP1397771.1 TraU family protein [Salmonella enterica]